MKKATGQQDVKAGIGFFAEGPRALRAVHAAYVADCERTKADFYDYDDWMLRERHFKHDLVVGTIVRAVQDLRFGIEKDWFSGERPADFDRTFHAVADNGIVAIGWRAAQSNYLIDVGPTASFRGLLALAPAACVAETGRSPEGLREDYERVSSTLRQYLKDLLIRAGVACGKAVVDGEVRAELATADLQLWIDAGQELIGTVTAAIEATKGDALKALSERERARVIEIAIEARQLVVFPMIDRDDNRVCCYNGDDEDDCGSELYVSYALPASLRSFAERLPANGMHPVPRDATTQDWFERTQADGIETAILASADEIAAATGEDVSIKVHLDVDFEDGSFSTQIHVASPPAPPASKP